MKGIFSVLVENKAGVLSKTAGLFARRGSVSYTHLDVYKRQVLPC